jgi:hypothetical protein
VKVVLSLPLVKLSGVRPHTPNSITGIKTSTNNQDRTYTYDANGSMTKNILGCGFD